MRVEPDQLLDDVGQRLVVPELDVEHVWDRGRRRRRTRQAGSVAVTAGIVLLAAVGLSSVWSGPGPAQPIVGDGGTPSEAPGDPHPVAVLEHDGQRITWRQGCPVPPQAVLLPGDPAPVDIDADGDPDLPGEACEYPPAGVGDLTQARASELRQLRDQLLDQRAQLLARLDALRDQPVEPDSSQAQLHQQTLDELRAHLARLDIQIAEIDLRLRQTVEDIDAQRILTYEPPRSYTMEIQISCFCPAEQAGTFRVRVVEGDKTEVVRVSSHPADPSVVDDPDSLFAAAPSIIQLQQLLRDTLAGGGEVTASLVADDGRPALIRLDPIPQAVDDEVTYHIKDWHVD